MTLGLALIAACASVGGALMETGGDLSRGTLVNETLAAAPGQPPDPGRPTFVFVHGWNPIPHALHFTMGRRFAEGVDRRYGASANVLSWNWNAATYVGLRSSRNDENAVQQGYALAGALRQAGFAPGRVHLVGHSSGCIVASAAARGFADGTGEAVAQLTLLEPATMYHETVFDRLAPWTSARLVENYWADGPSGYGAAVPHPGVQSWQVPTTHPHLGLVSPMHNSHLEVLRWYLLTIDDPSCPSGFNASLLRPGGP